MLQFIGDVLRGDGKVRASRAWLKFGRRRETGPEPIALDKIRHTTREEVQTIFASELASLGMAAAARREAGLTLDVAAPVLAARALSADEARQAAEQARLRQALYP